MNKQEFIDRLTAALNGRIPAAQVEDTIQYYQDYIHNQVRSGKSEAEVMGALGDPRLIARTIIETTQPAGDGGGIYNTAANYRQESYQSERQDSYTQYQNSAGRSGYRSFRIPGWLLIIIVIIVSILIIGAVFSVLSFLAPVIIVMLAVVFLIKLFRDWLN